MEQKKQSSSLAIPFALIGGGVAGFITSSPIAFFIGAAAGVILGYIFTGMTNQAADDNNNTDNA